MMSVISTLFPIAWLKNPVRTRVMCRMVSVLLLGTVAPSTSTKLPSAFNSSVPTVKRDLHDLAGQVLIGHHAVVFDSGAASVREILSHHGAVHHCVQQVDKVTECATHEDIVEIRTLITKICDKAQAARCRS